MATETEMLELTCKVSAWRLPHPRAWALLLASAIAAIAIAIAVVALRTPGEPGPTQRSLPVAVAKSAQGTCAPDSSAASIRNARQLALGGVLDAALRAARTRLHAPAATAAVVVCGHVVWADATGVVDLDSSRPANNRSLFILNSAAKTVVATMVMQEIQDGHLSLGTRLSQFYPWLPNARQVSVRMLLNMTSGLPDYLYNPRIASMIQHQPRHHWTVDQVLTGLGTGLGTPKFAPGRQYQYSDTNYIVLGAILEQITHGSIERDFQQLIARPLGITSSTWVPTPAAQARIAHPYLLYRNGSLRSQWIPGSACRAPSGDRYSPMAAWPRARWTWPASPTLCSAAGWWERQQSDR
jgi:D-alanyl-D-alanine carboxypeptidase